MLISIETYRTYDFPGGGVWTPFPPLNMRMISMSPALFCLPVKLTEQGTKADI